MYGYARLTVLSESQLRFEFINALNASVLDAFVLTSNHSFVQPLSLLS